MSIFRKEHTVNHGRKTSAENINVFVKLEIQSSMHLVISLNDENTNTRIVNNQFYTDENEAGRYNVIALSIYYVCSWH